MTILSTTEALKAIQADEELFSGKELPKFRGVVASPVVASFSADDYTYCAFTLRFTFCTDTGNSPVAHILLIVHEGESTVCSNVSVYNDTDATLGEQMQFLSECAELVKSVIAGRVSVVL